MIFEKEIVTINGVNYSLKIGWAKCQPDLYNGILGYAKKFQREEKRCQTCLNSIFTRSIGLNIGFTCGGVGMLRYKTDTCINYKQNYNI